MTTEQLLLTCRQAGIVLSAQGDTLELDAPCGALTPELRDRLARHKAELLAVLRPPRAFVTLKGGPTLPVEAVELALDLERRGFRQSIDAAGCYQVEPPAGLNGDDRARLARWRNHVVAVLRYCEQERVQ
jgi:hypothetical protein